MQFKSHFLALLLLLNSSSFGQNLTGTWEGGNTEEYLKMVIVQFGDSCFGYTYDESDGFCKANFIGTFNSRKQKLKIQGTDFIQRTPSHALCTFDLSYTLRGTDEYLTGTTKVFSALLLHNEVKNVLKKTTNSVDTTKLIAEKILHYQYGSTIPKSDLPASQTSEFVKRIETTKDSLDILFFVSEDIKNDTLTIFYNGEIIACKQTPGEIVFKTTVFIERNTENCLELLVTNTGRNSSNTISMHIIEGKKIHEIRFSPGLYPNAKINIVREK